MKSILFISCDSRHLTYFPVQIEQNIDYLSQYTIACILNIPDFFIYPVKTNEKVLNTYYHDGIMILYPWKTNEYVLNTYYHDRIMIPFHAMLRFTPTNFLEKGFHDYWFIND